MMYFFRLLKFAHLELQTLHQLAQHKQSNVRFCLKLKAIQVLETRLEALVAHKVLYMIQRLGLLVLGYCIRGWLLQQLQRVNIID